MNKSNPNETQPDQCQSPYSKIMLNREKKQKLHHNSSQINVQSDNNPPYNKILESYVQDLQTKNRELQDKIYSLNSKNENLKLKLHICHQTKAKLSRDREIHRTRIDILEEENIKLKVRREVTSSNYSDTDYSVIHQTANDPDHDSRREIDQLNEEKKDLSLTLEETIILKDKALAQRDILQSDLDKKEEEVIALDIQLSYLQNKQDESN